MTVDQNPGITYLGHNQNRTEHNSACNDLNFWAQLRTLYLNKRKWTLQRKLKEHIKIR